MMKTLIKNGRVIDPVNKLDGIYDILITEDKIEKIAECIEISDCRVVDVEGSIVLPGLIDMHTHLREPGFEEKETIISGCEAAAAGGFTSIACMPNTLPVADNPATVEYIKSKALSGVVNVYPIGSITKNSDGKELAEIGFLAEEGVRALSDDGKTVKNSEIMRRAMEYATIYDMTIIDHCEDTDLVGDGVMHEGYYSTILGLKPIPAAAEEIIIARDILLAELTGVKLHIAHLTTERGVEMVAAAKEKGLKITAEVTPHHLILTDKAVKGYDPDTKVNPPLRSRSDVEALRDAIKEGIIDAIATDHAPHTYEDKLGEFDYAECGISGLETALSLIYDRLIRKNIISWQDAVNLMAVNPAQILDINFEGIKRGSAANLTVFNPRKKWCVNVDEFKSKGKNTPFKNQELTGKPLLTVVAGKIVYDDRGEKAEIIY